MTKSWVYQLQNVDPAEIGKLMADVVVVDFSQDGTDPKRWKTNDVALMRGVNIHPWEKFAAKIPRVLSYISIGEAEDYRTYWRDIPTHPLWLGPENPEWKGNYKVEFWNGEWKAIIFKQLDKIMDAGFDGVYLDIIDAYEFYEEQGIHDAADRMIRFVGEISAHCKKRLPGFWIVPQNGEALLIDPKYRSFIDAFGKEDLLFGINGDGVANTHTETSASKKNLDLLKADGKPILAVEYLDNPINADAAVKLLRAWGYVPYITKRDLDYTTPLPKRIFT